MEEEEEGKELHGQEMHRQVNSLELLLLCSVQGKKEDSNFQKR